MSRGADIPCKIWAGAKSGPRGGPNYGHKTVNGKHVYVHVEAWEVAHGPVPEGLVVDHLCRVTLCYEVTHLEAVTQQVNILRGTGTSAKNAVKTHCDQGHEFTDQNTRVQWRDRGSRQTVERVCKTCHKMKGRRLRVQR
jgi:hypothetical protein